MATTLSSISTPSSALEQPEVGLLAERQHERIGLELLELARSAAGTHLVERHLLEHGRPSSACLTVDSHLTSTPSASASCSSESCAGMRSRVRR